MFIQKAEIKDGKIRPNGLGKLNRDEISDSVMKDLSILQRLNLLSKRVYSNVRRFGLSKFLQNTGSGYAPVWLCNTFNIVRYDTKEIVSTDIKIIKGSRPDTFEVSQKGTYLVTAHWTVAFESASVKKCHDIDLWLFKNGIAYERIDYEDTATLVNLDMDYWDYQQVIHLTGTVAVPLDKHDYFDIRLQFFRDVDGQDWGAWVNHSGSLSVRYYDNNFEVL